MAWDTGNIHHISLPLLPPHTGDLPVSKFFSCYHKSQRHNPERNTWNTGNTVHNPIQVRRIEGQEAWSPMAVATESRSQPAATQLHHSSTPCLQTLLVSARQACALTPMEPAEKPKNNKQWGKTAWKQTVGAAEFSSKHSVTSIELQPRRCEQAAVL